MEKIPNTPCAFCKLTNTLCKATVDRERFAGLNIRGFSAIKVFVEILSRCLGHKYLLFSTIKKRDACIHGKTFTVATCETLKNAKV